MSSVLLSIKWDPEWQEFSVPYYEDGVYKEGPTAYVGDLLEAQETLAANVTRLRNQGKTVSVRENQYTRGWEGLEGKMQGLTGSEIDELSDVVGDFRTSGSLHSWLESRSKPSLSKGTIQIPEPRPGQVLEIEYEPGSVHAEEYRLERGY